MPAIQTLTFLQETAQRFTVKMPATQVGVGGGAVALRRQCRRARYTFTLVSRALTRAEKDSLESFLKYHQSDIPFWWDGADFGIIQHRQLFGIGDGAQQDFFLPNDQIINGTVTVYEGGTPQAGVTITDATGLVQFASAPAADVLLEAVYQCRYKVFLVADTLDVERIAPQLYRVQCTLSEFPNG